jgi:DNA replication protein DnaC
MRVPKTTMNKEDEMSRRNNEIGSARKVSMILTSQMPVAHWHEQIGDPTIADSILDRLVHNAHRIELHGESMRKKPSHKPGEEDGQ